MRNNEEGLFMKKGILLFAFFIFFQSMNVMALESNSKWRTLQPEVNKSSNHILEKEMEVKKKTTKDGLQYKEYTITYIIPEDYQENEILFVPIQYMQQVVSSDEKDQFQIIIKNHTDKIFQYKNQSLVIATENLDMYSDDELGPWVGEAIGFNQVKIREGLGFYRTINSAILDLYQEINQITITESSLEEKLQEKGYHGISELNRYYLDFFNTKYHLTATQLEDLSDSAILDLLSGKLIEGMKEENKEILELAYNYYYNQLFFIGFDLSQNLHDFSVGSYMRKEASYEFLNDLFQEQFTTIFPNQEVSIEMPSFSVKKIPKESIYENYYSGIYVEFTLEANNEQEGMIYSIQDSHWYC